VDPENDKRDARLRTALANVGGNTAYRRTQVADQVWFRKRWEELGEGAERADDYGLGKREGGLQATVEAVGAILGLAACEGTEAVPPNARSHTALATLRIVKGTAAKP
jgi:hypothetical protein